MGRYYSGDIEGKFWFAVQDSDDADFFGVRGEQPNTLEYYFDKSNLPDVKKGIAECLKELGDYKAKFDKFFAKNNSYNDEMLVKEFGLKEAEIKGLLEWYARLELGEQIKKCIEKTGECQFSAEC